ncbi:hypothetical protein VitviT2T_013908 [Vitis vinifera]|uniref:Uncharacterized protein n=1 Tax=Vitis vinifera TaxID=29760 RepID=A0ABY9CJ36_VITVI|nr:hypothetical protein VitviT2T_013908 [Vitis vinifera]
MVGVLKKAMVQALVPYNAFAGKVVGLCNNRGVDFMETLGCITLTTKLKASLSLRSSMVSSMCSWVADAVHDNLEGAATNEPFLGLIDWVEAHRPELALEKIYCSGSSKGSPFVVSSRQRFPMSKMELIEIEAAYVFRPLTSEYLNLII